MTTIEVNQVGLWKLDEYQCVTIYDNSGHENHGTLTIEGSGSNTSAGTCEGASGEAWADGSTGKDNYSLHFDGTDDFINAGQVLDTDKSLPFSIAAWAKPDSGGMGGWRTILGTHSSYAQIAFSSSNNIKFGQNGGGGWWTVGPSISADTWYHIVGTYDGTYARLYVNGKLYDGPDSQVFDANHGVTLMGRYSTEGGEWMSGQTDDARVYNYALTEKQVAQLHQKGAIYFGPEEGSP